MSSQESSRDQFSMDMMDSVNDINSPLHESDLTRSLLSRNFSFYFFLLYLAVYSPDDNAEETMSEVESISEMQFPDYGQTNIPLPTPRAPQRTSKNRPIIRNPTLTTCSIFNKENFESFDDIEPITEPGPMKLESKTRLKIKIKRLKITGEWKWTAGRGDTCGICRAPFESACVECTIPGDDCPLVIGLCKHPFHLHCINKWTNGTNSNTQTSSACPLCRQEWIMDGS